MRRPYKQDGLCGYCSLPLVEVRYVRETPALRNQTVMKVNETRVRSLLKAVSFRIIGVAVDTVILSVFVTPAIALGLAVVLELTCFALHYCFERVWNRIDYGREEWKE